jgi:hypothetical protein
MSTSKIIFEISLLVNVALISLVLSMVYPKVIAWFKKRTKRRETQKNDFIRKAVRDYLNELKND